ncbi:cache domain-containing protein [Mangrovicoccus ximenensis]|uniref:cache domain-containing protein n=1 Tax=Mangrovicoccus ximenensis TaxID=1911570 RepID=UPI000D3AAABA|nr:hypothetical protein [Mangrovicoccus ximenensis]
MTLIRRRLLLFLLVLCGSAAVGLAAWQLSWSAALRLVAARAETDLTQTSERLIAQLQSYRELAVLLSDHPEVEALLRPGFAALGQTLQEVTLREAEELLQSIADKTGALRIGVYRRDGHVTARSDQNRSETLPLLWQEAAERAFQGALGLVTGVDPEAGRRSFAFASPVFGQRGAAPTGVLVVAVDLEAIEAEWPGGGACHGRAGAALGDDLPRLDAQARRRAAAALRAADAALGAAALGDAQSAPPK